MWNTNHFFEAEPNRVHLRRAVLTLAYRNSINKAVPIHDPCYARSRHHTRYAKYEFRRNPIITLDLTADVFNVYTYVLVVYPEPYP